MISPPEYQRMERWVQRARERTLTEYRRARHRPAAPHPMIFFPLWPSLPHPLPLESWLARVQWLGHRALELAIRHTPTGEAVTPAAPARPKPLRLPSA